MISYKIEEVGVCSFLMDGFYIDGPPYTEAMMLSIYFLATVRYTGSLTSIFVLDEMYLREIPYSFDPNVVFSPERQLQTNEFPD